MVRIAILLLCLVLPLLAEENKVEMMPGSFVSITDDRFYVGVEVGPFPQSSLTGNNYAMKATPVPLDKFSYIMVSSISTKLHPPVGTKGPIECLFLLHLSDGPEKRGSVIAVDILASNGDVSPSGHPSAGYWFPLRPTDKFLVAEIQEVSPTMSGVDCEMQVVGRLI